MKTAVFIALIGAAIAQADSLDAILTRMDASSKSFKSASADIKQTEYTALLKSSDDEFGTLKVKRGAKSVMAVLDYTKPALHTSVIKDKKATLYTPLAKTATEYDLGKYKSSVDQYVLLAFGSSGEELKKTYALKVLGTENVGSGAATRIELTPKSDEVKKLFTKFEMWIPEGQSYAIRLKATAPSDNFYLFDYSNVKINAAIPDSAFDLKLPKDVKINRP